MSIFDRLTDTSLYTGAHKARFDENGRGRGMAGRVQNTAGVTDLSQITRPNLGSNGTTISPNRSPNRSPVRSYQGDRRGSNASTTSSRRGSNASSTQSSQANSRSHSPDLSDMNITDSQYSSISQMFTTFAPRGEMDGAQFSRMCRDCGLLNKRFTPTDADLVFAKCKLQGERKITLRDFENKCIPALARAKDMNQQGIVALLLQGKPQLRGTAPKTGGIFEKLTDTKLYTGAHQARFDASGRGKGLAGRDMGMGGNIGDLSQITRPNLG